MNIFVEDTGLVHGVVDWEESRILPFGLFGWAIHFLAGEFLTVNTDTGEIEFVERPIYEEIERRFWNALLEHAPYQAKTELQGHMSLVQLAVITGTVLRVLRVYVVDGVEITDIHLPSLRALPRLLIYRIPSLRGPGEKPFGQPLGDVKGGLKSIFASI